MTFKQPSVRCTCRNAKIIKGPTVLMKHIKEKKCLGNCGRCGHKLPRDSDQFLLHAEACKSAYKKQWAYHVVCHICEALVAPGELKDHRREMHPVQDRGVQTDNTAPDPSRSCSQQRLSSFNDKHLSLQDDWHIAKNSQKVGDGAVINDRQTDGQDRVDDDPASSRQDYDTFGINSDRPSAPRGSNRVMQCESASTEHNTVTSDSHSSDNIGFPTQSLQQALLGPHPLSLQDNSQAVVICMPIDTLQTVIPQLRAGRKVDAVPPWPAAEDPNGYMQFMDLEAFGSDQLWNDSGLPLAAQNTQDTAPVSRESSARRGQ